MTGKYLTVAPDLIEHADRFIAHLRDDGFNVRIEAQHIEYPNTPTLLGIRNSTQHFVEVTNACHLKVLTEWSRYAGAQQHETYVSLVLPDGTDLKGQDLTALSGIGIGIFYSGDDGIIEVRPPRDLALKLSLPELNALPPKVRRKLRPAYNKFERGEWADGFKDACQVVEALARRRFVSYLASGRIQLIKTNGKPRSLSRIAAERLTLGQLATAHQQIVAPNQADTTIATVLSAINRDRVGATHRSDDGRVRARVRRNVSKHLWSIVKAMKVLV